MKPQREVGGREGGHPIPTPPPHSSEIYVYDVKNRLKKNHDWYGAYYSMLATTMFSTKSAIGKKGQISFSKKINSY